MAALMSVEEAPSQGDVGLPAPAPALQRGKSSFALSSEDEPATSQEGPDLALQGGTRPLNLDADTGQAPSQGKTAILAQCALATSQGRSRVLLEHLGPAVFNRQGNTTDSRHCHSLLKRIIEEEGFATFRYEAGYCHEANPLDPLMVARHALRMHALDSGLPRPQLQTLHGCFAKKTHLMSALQMYKAGQMKELEQYVKARSQVCPTEFEEFDKVLKFGLYMHVFPWNAVAKNKESFRALMAADNFSHGVGLSDSEMRCVHAMSQALGQVDSGVSAVPVQEKILAHVRRWTGQRWQTVELDHFWAFTISTGQAQLEFLNNVWVYAKFESVLVVSSDFSWV